jgi:hypothetical protein
LQRDSGTEGKSTGQGSARKEPREQALFASIQGWMRYPPLKADQAGPIVRQEDALAVGRWKAVREIVSTNSLPASRLGKR